MVVREIIDYLNEDARDEYSQQVLRVRIKNLFGLTEQQAEKVYGIWKSEYMKPKFKETSKNGGRVKI